MGSDAALYVFDYERFVMEMVPAVWHPGLHLGCCRSVAVELYMAATLGPLVVLLSMRRHNET
jgi:hypothetical protein